MVRIVMRNRGNGRKDAVYVVSAAGFTGPDASEYWVMGYWGPWDRFMQYEGTEGLRRQEKYHGACKGTLMETVQRICSEKLRKGYRVQEECSILPEWPILPYGQNWREYR